MFQRILVPLDGSDGAERAIPVAARIAHASGGSPAIPLDVKQKAIDKELDEVESYLEAVVRSSQLASIQVETKALAGPAAPEILAAAESLQADLLVMCSHGYTGFKRWAVGSVAQKVM